jgi:hypothetical protein
MRTIMRALMLLGLLLLSGEALAQAIPKRVWIAEFVTPRVEAAAPIATLPAAVKQPTLDISGGAKTSAPFSAQTRYIRVICEVQCAVSGSGSVAANDILLPALRPEYFIVGGGKTVSVIAVP